MFKKLADTLKHRAHPVLVLVAGLALIGLVTTLSGILHHQYELNHLSVPAASGVTRGHASGLAQTTSDTLDRTTTQEVPPQHQPSARTTAAKSSSSKADRNTTTGSAAAHNAHPSAAQNVETVSGITTVAISLSVNGSQKGTVTISNTANQCDVLTQALKTGLLSNLDMRYNSQYGTYAVYVINSVGDSSAVWWTYTVNGKSPPVGCGKTLVHNGDQVNWQYVKQ